MISIVMPYYNRRKLLIATLKSIVYYKGDWPIEIIIVDDGSTEKVNDIRDLFPQLDINLIVVERSAKWRGPTIAYNIGFNAVKGDVVLINCPECIHIGNIIEFVNNYLGPKMYISFSAYAATPKMNDVFCNINWQDERSISNAHRSIEGGSWRSHSTNYTLIPFCAAINTEDMETLSGYDERFESGIGYDDYDFTDRIKNLGLDSYLVDDPFIIHLDHPAPVYSNTINLDFLLQLRKDFPNRIKAAENKIYIKWKIK